MKKDGKDRKEYTKHEEYRHYPEYTPVYPDSSFFRESSVTMHEENVFSGQTPPGERSYRDEKKKEENDRKKKESILRLLLRSAAYTAAAVLAVGGLVALASLHGGYGTASGTKIAAALQTAQRPAFNEKQKYSNAQFAALWRGSEDAPHAYDYDHPLNISVADCLHAGSADYVCLECGIVHNAENVKGPHTPAAPVRENDFAPGCESGGGHEEVVYCAFCGEEISRTPVVEAALGHTPGKPVVENRSEQTCVAGGTYDEVIYCKYCGDELSRTQKNTDPSGHIPSEPTMYFGQDPTCTEVGYRYQAVYCVVCGEELSRKLIQVDPTGHQAADSVEENRTDASCTSGGSYDSVVYCSVCGDELERHTVMVPATGHSAGAAVRENEVAVTCTEAGHYDSVVYCTVCGEKLSSTATNVAATGHDYPMPSGSDVMQTIKCGKCGKNVVTLSYDKDSDTLYYSVDPGYADKLTSAGYDFDYAQFRSVIDYDETGVTEDYENFVSGSFEDARGSVSSDSARVFIYLYSDSDEIILISDYTELR